MSFFQIAFINLGWLVITVAATLELLIRKRMGSATVWFVTLANFTAGITNIANLWNVWLGFMQLAIFALSYIKRDALMK